MSLELFVHSGVTVSSTVTRSASPGRPGSAAAGKVFLMTEEGWQDDAPQLLCLDVNDGNTAAGTRAGMGKYSTGFGATADRLVLRASDCAPGQPVYGAFRVYSLPALKQLGMGFLAQPTPTGAPVDRWAGLTGWPNRYFGAAGTTCSAVKDGEEMRVYE